MSNDSSSRYRFYRRLLEKYPLEEAEAWGQENLPSLRGVLEALDEATFTAEAVEVRPDAKQVGRDVTLGADFVPTARGTSGRRCPAAHPAYDMAA